MAPSRGAEAQPTAADPVLEQRVQALSAELRCLVCQNQSLADSQAGLAIDLKNQVREQLKAGRTERQVIKYMTDRYGDFVLYRPPLKSTTVLLWVGPLLMLLLGALLLRRSLNAGREPQPEEPMDAEMLVRLQAILATPADKPSRDAADGNNGSVVQDGGDSRETPIRSGAVVAET